MYMYIHMYMYIQMFYMLSPTGDLCMIKFLKVHVHVQCKTPVYTYK